MTAVDFRKPDVIRPDGDDDPRSWDVPDRADHHDYDRNDDQEPEQDTAPEAALDEPDGDPGTMRLLAVIAGVGGLLLAAIGFTGSYNTLRHLAESKNFGLFSYAFPIGIDAGILVLLALDLYMMRKRMPLPILRWSAHGLTTATVVFNAAAAGPVREDPLAAAMHGVIPVLFIIAVEAARHYIGRMADLLAGETPLGSVPLTRWILSPLSTPRLARRMRLYNLPYKEAAAQHQQLRIYREGLRQKYDDEKSWRKAATANEMLPFKLAPFGFSVERSLGVPLEEETRRLGREAQAAVQRAEAEIQRVKTDVQLGAARIQAEVDKIRAEGRLKIARAEAEREAQAEIQRAEADAQLREAKRQHALKLAEDQAAAEAQELADETEKRRTLSQIDREKVQASWGLEKQQMATEATEQERRIQADAAARARRDEVARAAGIAEQEQRRAEAETARTKALEEAAEHERKEAEHRAETVNKSLEAQRGTEEIALSAAREEAAKEEAAEHRARAAEHEARAVESAALTRLNQVEWDVRRVVAMIQARGESAVTVRVIADELGVSTGSAQDRKTRAVDFLTEDGVLAPQQAVA